MQRPPQSSKPPDRPSSRERTYWSPHGNHDRVVDDGDDKAHAAHDDDDHDDSSHASSAPAPPASATANQTPAFFSMRIVDADSYMTAPVPSLDVMRTDHDGSSCHRVPVIRLYGSTPAGQRTCLHIHRVFPYIYIPYYGPTSSDRDVRQYCCQMAVSIDVAVDAFNNTGFSAGGDSTAASVAASRQNPGLSGPGRPAAQQAGGFANMRRKGQHVFKIVLAQGAPFYGYAPRDRLFLKIFLFNPATVGKVVHLLQSGFVMGREFQPYEAHIPFLLQFLIDFNLYGMNFVQLSLARFRQPLAPECGVNPGRIHDYWRPVSVVAAGVTSAFSAEPIPSQHSLSHPHTPVQTSSTPPPALLKLWNSPAARRVYGPSGGGSQDAAPHATHQFSPSKAGATTASDAASSSLLAASSLPSPTVWTADTIPTELLSTRMIARQSTCEIEIDALCSEILNRHDIKIARLTAASQPGTAFGRGSVQEQNLVQSLASLWDDERARRRSDRMSSQITPPGTQERELPAPAPFDVQLRQRMHDLVTLQPDDARDMDDVRVGRAPTLPSTVVDTTMFPSQQHRAMPVVLARLSHGQAAPGGPAKVLFHAFEPETFHSDWREGALSPLGLVHDFPREAASPIPGMAMGNGPRESAFSRVVAGAPAPPFAASSYSEESQPRDRFETSMMEAAMNEAYELLQQDLGQDGRSASDSQAAMSTTSLHTPARPQQPNPRVAATPSSQFQLHGPEPRMKHIQPMPSVGMHRALFPEPMQESSNVHEDDSEPPLPTNVQPIVDTARLEEPAEVNEMLSVLEWLEDRAQGLTEQQREEHAHLAADEPAEDELDGNAVHGRDNPNAAGDHHHHHSQFPTSLSDSAADENLVAQMSQAPKHLKQPEFAPSGAQPQTSSSRSAAIKSLPATDTDEMQQVIWTGHTGHSSSGGVSASDSSSSKAARSTNHAVSMDSAVSSGPTCSSVTSVPPTWATCQSTLWKPLQSLHSDCCRDDDDDDDAGWSPTLHGWQGFAHGPDELARSILSFWSPEPSRSGSPLQQAFTERRNAIDTFDPFNPEHVASVCFLFQPPRCDSPTHAPASSQESMHPSSATPARHVAMHVSPSARDPSPVAQDTEDDVIMVMDVEANERRQSSATTAMDCGGTATIQDVYTFAAKPPSRKLVQDSLQPKYHLPSVAYTEPFFGNPKDVPPAPTVFAGREFPIKSNVVACLPEFHQRHKTGRQWSLYNAESSAFARRVSTLSHHDDHALEQQPMPGRSQDLPSSSGGDLVILSMSQHSLPEERAAIPSRMPPPPRGLEFWKAKYGALGQLLGDTSVLDQLVASPDERAFVPGLLPPSCLDVKHWLGLHTDKKPARSVARPPPKSLDTSVIHASLSQIEGPTPRNEHQFKASPLAIAEEAQALHGVQHVTILSLEVHVNTRGDFRPDPEHDRVAAIVYLLRHDAVHHVGGRDIQGVIMVAPSLPTATTTTTTMYDRASTAGSPLQFSGLTGCRVTSVADETALFMSFIDLVAHFDPDFLVGYELQMLSLGYLVDRARRLQLDLCARLARCPTVPVTESESGSTSAAAAAAPPNVWKRSNVTDKQQQQQHQQPQQQQPQQQHPPPDQSTRGDAADAAEAYNYSHSSGLQIGGRVVLNVWRLMRSEIALNIYSFENVVYHILHQRIPKYTFRTLSDWWLGQSLVRKGVASDLAFQRSPFAGTSSNLSRWRTVQYLLTKARLCIDLLDETDFIGRTSELGRIFGILFESVITRGSQFRVESMMLRLAKPMNFIPISPSKQQVAQMRAPECVPLILEPESRFYTSPVLVLDFQSLYPSVMIAYNICYSTCLGRMSRGLERAFGISTLQVPKSLSASIADSATLTPNSVIFVKKTVRVGVLPRLLDEILRARVMVKDAMKRLDKKIRQLQEQDAASMPGAAPKTEASNAAGHAKTGQQQSREEGGLSSGSDTSSDDDSDSEDTGSHRSEFDTDGLISASDFGNGPRLRQLARVWRSKGVKASGRSAVNADAAAAAAATTHRSQKKPEDAGNTSSHTNPPSHPSATTGSHSTRNSVSAELNELRALRRILNARQLGLKMIANVTYGYTSANFSGRMPCVEIADSIVAMARQTLERGIDLVNKTSKWGARVVYGDTDSMFVLLPGATRERAFQVGREIAESVTAMNPSPVRLKFEKVYHPCVLQAKKRYVGASYEFDEQREFVFDAKGIETVRRDGCKAVSKTLEKSLKILFRSANLSRVKAYVQRQFRKLLEERVALSDIVFAKELRDIGGYKDPLMQPVALLSIRARERDPRALPRHGERVPYVVVHGPPGSRLIDGVRAPEEFLNDPTLRIHGTYYITRQIIPALERVFQLVGVDVRSWFDELPKTVRLTAQSRRHLQMRQRMAEMLQHRQREARQLQIEISTGESHDGDAEAATAGIREAFPWATSTSSSSNNNNNNNMPNASSITLGGGGFGNRRAAIGRGGRGNKTTSAALRDVNNKTISQFYASVHCPVCAGIISDGQIICVSCRTNSQQTALLLSARMARWDGSSTRLEALCGSCANGPAAGDLCVSLDCPVNYDRHRLNGKRVLQFEYQEILSLLDARAAGGGNGSSAPAPSVSALAPLHLPSERQSRARDDDDVSVSHVIDDSDAAPSVIPQEQFQAVRQAQRPKLVDATAPDDDGDDHPVDPGHPVLSEAQVEFARQTVESAPPQHQISVLDNTSACMADREDVPGRSPGFLLAWEALSSQR
ncbi:DNA polymerase zeta catalytic subunit [Capsaspora owczarzaki ATCC 30864]|uniref:DNA polymerase zeta catalytic subunit n=1 Tax=Capsaspora owczarzaki (strain ATCC 30864) TaxID=595528 RepID=A0A0D2WNX9_CAPO3|nr:DNA polymerase zeta catalytic subunit [Capsaspora owczarzaki ATCC 30864]KJE92975.1 DNA polymerase zeta catalytic subunit [Capsaspora owczarzaki ATCC 30864]|eukprot:XP_004363571.1 DNA polymerase zeta catalytic subunit [Capsaspora owczarzaki ATCC 30864]